VSDGEIKGVATSGIASSDCLTPDQREYLQSEKAKLRERMTDSTNPAEIRKLLAEAKNSRDSDVSEPMYVSATATNESPAVPGLTYPIKLSKRADAPPIGEEADALIAFRLSARNLKAAELAFRDAQLVYADAVKRLSEEAVK
jgi:hypothetical protein